MRKLIWIAVVVLVLAGFYVVWPAWSGYQIREAIQTEDAAVLARKVDYPVVRQSLRPVVAAEVRATLERLGQGSGALGQLLAAQIKDDLINQIADATVEAVVTPEATIRMVRQGGNLRDAFRRVMSDQVGRSGPVPGRRPAPEAGSSNGAPQPASGQTPPATTGGLRTIGLANIKAFAMTGPVSFQIGLARDPAAVTSDVFVELAFRGFDWKVVGVIPRPLNPS